MQPTPEVEAFIACVDALPSGPGVSLDAVLQPSLDEEAELRKLFATDRKNTRLNNPYVGLVDVFHAPDSIRTTRARIVQGKEDLSAKYAMPISEDTRRKEGTPAMVADLEEFKKNWSIFTEGSLSQLVDWNNVVAAGGSVLACLTPLDEDNKTPKRAIRKFYHSNAYPTSDIDLFLWGMTPEQAEAKIKTIYEAVRDSVPWDVTCIRTKHTVSIHSQYPYRSVQIILRLYQSPAEILAGFDIDAPCCAYDGDRVWANPRAIVAMMRQCNTIDMTRRSPSYEIRLSKYSQRAFEVYIPTLKRTEIDPTIYERSIARMAGLARLLVLEKLKDDNMRDAFLLGRRQLRGRPAPKSYQARHIRKYKGDLKAETGMGVEMNDYDVASLHIPYGPGWDARRIDKLIYQTDLGMNSTFNPKNKGRRLHRHPAFFGTIEECLEDCCEHCPEPIDEDERNLQKEEDQNYIRGRIQFIEENPGRQSISGSFNPIDVGEWSEQVYIRPTQQLFTAIAAHDRSTVQKLLVEGIDLNQRDHVGRTSLHVAIFSKAVDIACDLIDAGARITARLADGRSSLHLAAQYDQLLVIQKLLERNSKNVADAEKKKGEEDVDAMDSQKAVERPSSDDDWSSHDDDGVEMVDADEADEDENSNGGDEVKLKARKAPKSEATQEESGDIPEVDDQADIIDDIDALDWDLGFSALSYAILFASLPTLDGILGAGADINVVTKPSSVDGRLHPLALTILREDQGEACIIAERLIKAGASSSTADEQMRTILHAAVYNGRTKLVETLLRCDPHAGTVVNFPALQGQNVIFPIVTAINKKHYGLVALLLAHDAKLDLDEKDITRAQEAAKPEIRRLLANYGDVKNYVNLAYQPLETAIRNHDDLSKLLIALGAPVDVSLLQSLAKYSQVRDRRTLREWIDYALDSLSVEIAKLETEEQASVDTPMKDERKEERGWKGFYRKYHEFLISPSPEAQKMENERKEQEAKQRKETLDRRNDIKDFFLEIQGLLRTEDPKTWKDVYPTVETRAGTDLPGVIHREPPKAAVAQEKQQERDYSYAFISSGYNDQNVPEHSISAYDELYEACFSGDNQKIQKLCLPVEGQGTTATTGAPGPLNISVKTYVNATGRYEQTGYTPLFAAISGRRWLTAKLILAIATAQYHPSDENDKIQFNNDVDMDDDPDSDNESIHSDDSDVTIEQQEVKFIDVATRPSAVQCDIHPKKMLDVPVLWRKPHSPTPVGPAGGQAYPLMKAVVDQDLEAFVHIANLYDSLSQNLELNADVLDVILQQDQPDILDEYIRRTGNGINVAGAVRKSATLKDGEAEPQVATNDVNKIYFGLNVHGKKRMDLARKGDPNASQGGEQAEFPLVWRAARVGAKDILAYLVSERPLAAYKFYGISHSDPKAIWFRRMGSKLKAASKVGEAEKRLAVRLGWTINSLGESPLVAAIVGKDLETLKVLAKLQPALMKQALQTKIKFIGSNPLILAVRAQCDNKMMDYLLSKDISPADHDSVRGWNIYHHICELNNGQLLEYFLNKLPKDVNEALLEQQSNTRLNTPLHIAVKKGSRDLVKILLAYSTSTILTRDVDGQTPLHCAVKSGFASIIQQLLSASPAATQALSMENSVGNTPVESSALLALTACMHVYAQNANIYRYAPAVIRPSAQAVVDPLRLSASKWEPEKVEGELRAVRDVLGWFDGARGEGQAKLDVGACVKWVNEMEGRVAAFKEKTRMEQERKKEEAEMKKKSSNEKAPVFEKENGKTQLSFQYIQELLKNLPSSSSSGQRQLIHLLDVQKSVSATLFKVDSDNAGDYPPVASRMTGYQRRKNRVVGGEGQLEAEEDEDRKMRKMSIVFQHFGIGPDTL